jgi:hypothetical protein
MKRYVSIDILKGFSMFLVLFFHVLTRSLDFSIIENTLDNFSLVNLPFYFVIIIIGYIAEYDIVYICISAFGNIFSVQRQWDRQITVDSTSVEKKALFRKIMKTQLIRGAFIAFLGYFSEWILNGMIVDIVLQKENWATGSIGSLFFAQILTVMAINNVILSFICLTLLRGGKKKHIPMVLLCLMFGFIAVTPGIIELYKLNPMIWNNLTLNWEGRGAKMNLLMFIVIPYIKRFTPIFPNFSASALGAIIAFKFSQEGIQKKFLNRLVLCSILFMAIGAIFAHLEYIGIPYTQDYKLGAYLLTFAGAILYILFFIYFFEIRGTQRTIKYSKLWRRFGIFTLSIWCLQWLIIFPAWLVQVISNWISGTWTTLSDSPLINNGLNLWQFALALVFITCFYYGILWLWEKIHYIGTFEWMTVKLISRSHRSAKNRLNMEQSLHNVESYVPERINMYKWWQLVLIFFTYIGFAGINAFFYLI